MVSGSKLFFTVLVSIIVSSCGVDGGFPIKADDNKQTIYITSTAYQGNFGGSAIADTRCMSDANYPGSGTFKAMVVDSARRACTTAGCSGGVSEHLGWVLSPSTTYYRASDGTEIGTTNSNGLFTFPLSNTWAVGTTYALWTGLESNWTSHGSNCTNWSNNGMGPTTKVGLSDEITTDAISQAAVPSCDSTIRFICVKQ